MKLSSYMRGEPLSPCADTIPGAIEIVDITVRI